MGDPTDRAVEDLLEQLLRTGIMLSDLIADLHDGLPPGAFGGEDPMDVLLEMVAGSMRPVTAAYGAEALRGATALIGAAGDRVIADLEDAAARSRHRG